MLDENVYAPKQVEAILENIGVDIAGETSTNFLAMCPFHYNRHTPAFSVSKREGFWICFNTDCNERGNLPQLVARLTNRDKYETKRYIAKKGSETQVDVAEEVERILDEADEEGGFPEDVVERLKDDFWFEEPGREYMHGRGFNDQTLEYFDIGYSVKNNMVAVPVHSPRGELMGIVGRSIEGKRFKNSKGLARNKTLFNLHRARRESDTVIITESTFDTMRVHQAGYPNSVGTLGGHFADTHFKLLRRHFNNVIIMVDNPLTDKAGKKLGELIAAGSKRMFVMWAAISDDMIYPEGTKDACDLTDEQIRKMVDNAITGVDYEYIMEECNG